MQMLKAFVTRGYLVDMVAGAIIGMTLGLLGHALYR